MTIIYYIVLYLLLCAIIMRVLFGAPVVREFWVLLTLALIMTIATL